MTYTIPMLGGVCLERRNTKEKSILILISFLEFHNDQREESDN